MRTRPSSSRPTASRPRAPTRPSATSHRADPGAAGRAPHPGGRRHRHGAPRDRRKGVSMRHEIKVADADPAEEVEVVQINVAVGAAVKAGEALMEIASDKANMDLTAPV